MALNRTLFSLLFPLFTAMKDPFDGTPDPAIKSVVCLFEGRLVWSDLGASDTVLIYRAIKVSSKDPHRPPHPEELPFIESIPSRTLENISSRYTSPS